MRGKGKTDIVIFKNTEELDRYDMNLLFDYFFRGQSYQRDSRPRDGTRGTVCSCCRAKHS